MKKMRNLALGICAAGLLAISTTVAEDYFEISKNLEIFNSVYRELNIYYVDETQPGALMKTGIDAMLGSLDPYTVYYPESRVEDARFIQTGEYGGIGAVIQVIGENVTVVDPYEDYPAVKSGLKAGDVILSVDGEDISGKTQDEVSDFLKGQAGTEINLVVKRPNQEATIDVVVERADIKIPEVPHSGMLDEKTGYIKLSSFTKTATNSVKKAFQKLKGEGMEQLVFDLRGNGGGLLREAVNIVNLWVDKDQEVVSTKGKLEEWNRTHKTLREAEDANIPIVVLVNGSSASASEIVSGALQDLDRAVVLGNVTFGKGLVQQTKDVSYNAKMKLTVAKYYIPSGRCIQKLDYSNRDDLGKVSAVDKESIRTFYTTGGREVYDGRGVAPDVELENLIDINILNGLMSNYIIFDYATQYASNNPSPESAVNFKLSDAEYDQFKAYVLSRDFDYATGTEALFAEIKKVAKDERYYDNAKSAFAELEKAITPSKDEDLDRFGIEIKQLLEGEIISRYHYQTGRIVQQLQNDPWVDEAIQIFGTRYREILQGTN